MKLTHFLLTVMIAFTIAGCGGGGGGSSGGSSATVPPVSTTYDLTGTAQKGPFAIGSQISVNTLDSNLNATGQVFNVQTTDNLGSFSVPNVGTKLVKIVGNGFYMDELTGQLSSTQITLTAVADLSVNASPTVNVLTSLQEPRLKALIASGMTFSAAYAQSQSEVLSVFGINSTAVSSLSNLYSMSIDGSTNADAVLLATSVILSQMASNAAVTNGTSQPAELSNYINTIAAELVTSGVITDNTFVPAKIIAESQINIGLINTNLISYYSKQGVTMTPPLFAEWVDQSNSGILPQLLVPVTGLTFDDVAASQPFQVNTSNTITISGLNAGVVVPVSVSTGTIIIKNGVALTSVYTTVQNGDTIALQETSGAVATTTSATFNAGSTTVIWSVTSRTPDVEVEYGMLAGGASNANSMGINYGGNTIDSSLYFAFPIVSANSFVAGYVGVGLFYGGTNEAISIYSDNASQPNVSIASTTTGVFLGGANLSSIDGTSYTPPANGLSEGYFGNSGVSLAANTPYWVVVKFPIAQLDGIIWQGTQTCVNGVCSPSPAMPSTPAPRFAMMSQDGITWTNITGYQGVIGTSNASVMPLVYLTN